MSERKKVLVTGANGFIGSHMIDCLRATGNFDIVATDIADIGNISCSSLPTLLGMRAGVDFIAADLTRPESLAKVFDRGPFDYIFHIAAVFNYSASLDLLRRVNVGGTRNLLSLVKQHSPDAVTVVWSSGSVYGVTGFNATHEEDPVSPKNFYERSKREQELLAMEYARSHNLKIAVIRPAAVYGPRSKYGAAIPLLMIAKGQIPCILGSGNVIESFVHAEDVVRSALFLAENHINIDKFFAHKPEENRYIFNVCDDSAATLESLFLHVATCLREVGRTDVKLLPLHLPLWVLRPLIWWNEFSKRHFGTELRIERDLVSYLEEPFLMSNAKLTSVMGYRLRHPDIEKGLRGTVEWYAKEGMV